jgi:predicted nuclease with RNAse H fold
LDTKDLGELSAWVWERRPEVVAVDAPSAPSRGLRAQSKTDEAPKTGRQCDYELRRRGIPLYEVPLERASAAPWMKVGFEIYSILFGLGYRLPTVAGPIGSVIEVFPHASFVTLLGGVPARKSTVQGREQRLALLRQRGLVWGDRTDHDSLDALVAAFTGMMFLEGRACAVGHPDEALIWLPVQQLKEHYSRLRVLSSELRPAELARLHSELSDDERDELLQCLLSAAPRGGEAMLRVLENMLVYHAVEEALGERSGKRPFDD